MRRLYFINSLIALVCALVCTASTAAAQNPRPGTLRVVVKDATDLPISGATVVAISSTGNDTRSTTNESGQATIDGLPPGTYRVRVESPGFDPLMVENVSVRAGA